jgi:MFS transporter, putative metabolite:H+ symporter
MAIGGRGGFASDDVPPSSLMNASIAARLDRLPLCRFHHRFIGLISIGSWFEFFDLFIMGYLGAALQSNHFLTLYQFSELVSAGFLGMFIGTILQGMASDYMGRRSSFIFTLLLYSIFSIAGAFSTTPAMLILMRFLAGLGIAGQQVIVVTYISEMIPGTARGRYVAISQFVGFSAVTAMAYLSSLLVPTHWLLAGWRWVMIIGGMGAIFSWFILRRVRESPRWLESKGRVDEAQRIMNDIEEEVQRDTGKPLPARTEHFFVATTHRAPMKELWSPAYRSRTIMLVIFNVLQTIGFYGFANWAPTFLLHEGRNIGQSLNYGFLFALMYPIGPLVGYFTAERLERKRVIVMLSLLMASTGLAFAFVRSPVTIIIIGAFMTALSSWFATAFHAYQAELFPTRARATGVGFVYSASRISAVFSTFIIGALLVHGIVAVFSFVSLALVGVALVVGIWGPRTNAIALEKLSS